jgi:RNA polymerase sigma factor (sigma-70 family)
MTPLEDWNLKEYRESLKKRAGILLRDPRVRLLFDVSDLVEETLVRAVRFHNTYQGGTTDPERYAWLEKIENNVLIEIYKARFTKMRDPRREQHLHQALADSSLAWEPEADQATPSEIAVRNEDQARMLAALERLPQRERDLVRAIHFEHLSLTDAAARVGINSVGHGSRVYQRALKMLRELLS